MTRSSPPQLVSYQSSIEDFRSGKDSPRDFLERCIGRLDEREPRLHAFSALSLPRARIAADAATIRWREGRPLSRIDGMPVGIKDIIETFDMPTGMGSPTHDGNQPLRDAATVFALRDAGAAVVGKTKTTEFAGSYATDTRNPHDIGRTSGGSSAGSASAVGAGIVPVALGTQVMGSTIRPSSFCGAYGYKPTFGGINRGGSHDFQSHSCIGVIGASLQDIWCSTYDMVQRAGGDPGEPGLLGAAELADPERPARLVQLETPGWEVASAEARSQLENLLSRLSAAGVQILTRHNNEAVAAFERSLGGILKLGSDIVAYESRWPLKSVAYRDRLGLSPVIQGKLEMSDGPGIDGYRDLLRQRVELRTTFAGLLASANACITLGAPGAAPRGITWTGHPGFNVPASVLGVPALTLPLLQDDGLPLGVQLIGAQHTDAPLFGLARWVEELALS